MSAFEQNPEFRRSLWLEFSPQRLILMPLVILLVLFVVGSFDAATSEKLSGRILSLSLLGFVGLTIIWGCVQVSNALGHEFSDGTWDSQRMSSLTPWQMAWGKLLGGTLYAWYGGGILLTIAFFAASIGMKLHFPDILRGGAGLILLALLLHTLSVMWLLLRWQQHPGKAQGRINIIGPLILLWLLGGFLFSVFMRFTRELSDIGQHAPHWYGMKVDENFLLFFLGVLVIWAIIGLWQLMRRELLLRNRPWWWLAFLLFWIFWCAGFVPQQEQEQEKIWAVFFMVCAMLTWISVYLLILFEKKDPAFWIRLIAAWKRRDSELLQHLLPNWLVSFALALVLSVCALLLFGSDFFFRNLLCLISVTAFVLRDTAWILWLNLNPRARYPDSAALVSLAVAYGVLPWLSTRVFFPLTVKEMSLFTKTGTIPASELTTLFVLLATHLAFAAAAFWLLRHRFRKTFGKR
jgi:hypothetical protein